MSTGVAAAGLDAETFAALLDTIRRFVRERLIPIEEQVDREDAIPADVLAEMRALGLYGVTVPAEYGGIGLGAEESARVFL